MRGLFVTFEGVEGSGKSTQMDRLARLLSRRGQSVLKTREPGGTAFGEQIRDVLLSIRNRRLDPRAELFLYLASRTQHLEEVILPALEKGKIVLCDRFSDATLAYQGYGRRLSMALVRPAVAYSAKGLSPDLTILLDINVRRGLARVRQRGKANRIDREDLAFHERVRRGYLALARREPRRIVRVMADRDADAVAGEIQEILNGRLHRRAGKRHAG